MQARTAQHPHFGCSDSRPQVLAPRLPLCRLLAQPALALALAQCGALPQPWGDRLARLAVAASAACIVFLVQHLPMKGEPRWAGPGGPPGGAATGAGRVKEG